VLTLNRGVYDNEEPSNEPQTVVRWSEQNLWRATCADWSELGELGGELRLFGIYLGRSLNMEHLSTCIMKPRERHVKIFTAAAEVRQERLSCCP
jgi:hypothetical protein